MTNKCLHSVLFPEDAFGYDLPLWEELTLGGAFWNDLRSFLLGKPSLSWEDWKHGLEKWRCFFIEVSKSDFPYIEKQWQIAMRILELAEIARSKTDSGITEDAWEKEIIHWFSQGCARKETEKTETIRVLLIDEVKEQGITGKLTLSLIPQGRGQIYRSPDTNSFLLTDEEFEKAIEHVRQFLKTQKLWDDSGDIRWQLGLDNHPKALEMSELTGSSMSSAFAIAMWKLLQKDQDLDLKEVASTATFTSCGAFEPVKGIWEKLGSCCRDLAKRKPLQQSLLSLVVVASRQNDVPEEYRQENSIPRVVFATDLEHAIEEVRKHHRPRKSFLAYMLKKTQSFDLFDRTVLPMATHYQRLPLWKKVGESPQPHEKGKSSQDLLQWEDEIRKNPSQYKEYDIFDLAPDDRCLISPQGFIWGRGLKITEHSVSSSKCLDVSSGKCLDVFTKIPRLIVLGPPGSGKTTWLRYVAWNVVQTKTLPDEKNMIPVLVSLKKWEHWSLDHKELGIAKFLSHHFRDKIPFSTESALWIQWLDNGEILLLLDGLDELADNSDFWEVAIQPTLTRFPHCPAIITCRTVNFKAYQGMAREMPVFLLGGLISLEHNSQKRDDYIRSFPAQHQDRYEPEKLIQQINANPSMRPLTSNPLVLSFLCRLVDDPVGIELPATRSQFYEKIMVKLFQQNRERGNRVNLLDSQKKDVLADTALRLFLQPKDPFFFDEASLSQAIRLALADNSLATTPLKELLNELSGKCGLLRGNEEEGYFFLHRTFHEYLIGHALARRLNQDGIQAQMTVNRGSLNLLSLIQRNLTKRSWHQPVHFLLEELQDSEALYSVLQHVCPVYHVYEHGEDAILNAIARLKDSGAERFSQLLCQIMEEKEEDRLLHRQLFFVAKIIGRAQAFAFLEKGKIMQRLHHLLREDYFKDKVCQAYIQLNAKKSVDDLIPLLKDTKCNFFRDVCQAIAKLGTRKHLKLVWPLFNKKIWTHEHVEIVKKFADRQDLSKLLSVLLSPLDTFIRQEIQKEFCKLTNRNDLPWLLSLLKSGHTDLFYDIFISIGARDDFPLIQPYLKDPRPEVRKWICQIIRHFENPEDLPLILDLLQDEDADVREVACCSFFQLGNRESLKHLALLLQDPYPIVRCRICQVVAKWGLTEDLDSLKVLLEEDDSREENFSIALGFLEAIKKLGDSRHLAWIIRIALVYQGDYGRHASEAFVHLATRVKADGDMVLPLLQAQSPSAREFACCVLSELGTKEKYADAIARLMDDENADVVSTACDIVGKWAFKEYCDKIRELTQHPDSKIRRSVCGVIERFGNRDNIQDLIPLIQDKDRDVRQAVGQAFTKLATPEDLPLLKPLFRDNEPRDDGLSTGNEDSNSWRAYNEKASVKNLPDIIEFLKNPDPENCVWVCEIIQKIGSSEPLPYLFPLLYRKETVQYAYHAVKTLGRATDIHQHISSLLKQKEWELRRYGCWLIRDLGTQEHILLILPMLKDRHRLVRYSAYEALDALTKASSG